jgi:hypothetical protein
MDGTNNDTYELYMVTSYWSIFICESWPDQLVPNISVGNIYAELKTVNLP